MPLEIERKFLVDPDKWSPVTENILIIEQGYIDTDPEHTIRVRIEHSQQQAWLTVKGLTTGATRQEFEYEVPYDEGIAMMAMTLRRLMKTRHVETHGGKTWEIDVFEGGLLIAEIELDSAEEAFSLPAFITEEVTGDPRYYNLNLST